MISDGLMKWRSDRRELLRATLGFGIGASAISGLLAACGSDDADDDVSPDPVGDVDTDNQDSDENQEGEVDSADGSSDPKQGGVLVWGMGGDADALDPHTTSAWAAWRQSTMMYESLVRKSLTDTEGTPEIEPQLAESWSVSDDGLVWSFKLREGVKFHDGTDFNAEAVTFNYRRMEDEDFEHHNPLAWHGTYAFRYTESVAEPDEYTWEVTNREPVGEFLAKIGDYYWFGIASPTQIEAVGTENLATNPSGTGPFRFVERIPGQHTEFERNDDYWGDPPYIDRLIVRPILEDQARVVALQTGEIDLMSDPPPDVIQSLRNEGFVYSDGLSPQVAYYRFQFRNEFAQDVRVRQAVSYAINREAIARDLFVDTAIPAYGLLVPGAPAYDEDWEPFPYDPDRARELLTEAGYPDGFKSVLASVPTASGWPQAGAVAQFIRNNLADVGIELELELTEWVTYLGFTFRDRPEVFMWGTAWGMPTNFFLHVEGDSRFRSIEDPNNSAYTNRENPREELDELLIAGERELDPDRANEFYRQANELMMVEDCALLAITHDKMPHLMKPEVKGWVQAINVNYSLTQVWIDD